MPVKENSEAKTKEKGVDLNMEARMIRYGEDEVILEEGQNSEYMYKIVSGLVTLYTNHKKPGEYAIGVLSAPDTFGEVSLLTDSPSPYAAVSFGETLIMQVSRDEFEDFISNNAKNAMEIMQNLAKKIVILDTHMDMMSTELKELDPGMSNDIIRRKIQSYSVSGIGRDPYRQGK